MIEKLKNWKSSIVGITVGIATILGFNQGQELIETIYTVITAIGSLWLMFKSKD